MADAASDLAPHRRYFLALLPPPDLQAEILQIQRYFRQHYASQAALRSPPHITLQAPFTWPADRHQHLQDCLEQFASAQPPISITLSGFAAFPPRVIFVNVAAAAPLSRLQANLVTVLNNQLQITDPSAKSRCFKPHMTVAFRDLTPQSFQQAWLEFQHRPLQAEFIATELTLLIHNGQGWSVDQGFSFSESC